MAKKSIAVIYGGNSSEHQVSIQSGKNVAANLDRERYDVYEILIKGKSWTLIARNGEEMEPAEIDKTDFSAAGVHFDVAFIMIHGTPGEACCRAILRCWRFPLPPATPLSPILPLTNTPANVSWTLQA